MQMMDDWRTPAFRQSMISKIEEAIQHCGANMNGSDLEGQLFNKARHKEDYMSLVTRIIMHIKDKGSKKHGVGQGVMGQPNQPQGPGPGVQMGGPMAGGQTNMGMMNQMNPMAPMNQMSVMGQQGMVHQMQQPQLQMQAGMSQPPHTTVMGGLQQQQPNQQAQQQHQIPQQQGQMMGQNQMQLGMSQGQIQIPQQMQQQLQNAQMGNPQMQQQLQMQNVQMQQALMQQGNSQQIMMANSQQQVIMQGNQPQQTMIGAGQPQMMMQGNAPQQTMLQATSQAQQGVMTGAPQQGMMQGGPQQQQQAPQQPGMMAGPPQQQQPGNQPQPQMMQVRGIPNPQMAGNLRGMNPQPNVSTALTALAHAQHARKAQQQQPRQMVPNAMGIPRPEHGPNYSMNRLYYTSNVTQAQVDNVPVNVQFPGVPPGAQMQQRPVGQFVQGNASQGMASPAPAGLNVPGQMSQPQQQATFVNSPGSQGMMHRPPGPGVNVSSLSPFPNQMVSVPSPNTNLNTPMPMAPTPSPRNAEDQACFEKIKELKKYTDLLQRMIAKIGNEDMEKSSKMKKLLEILTNPNQRVSMEILLKCEAALKKMERQQDTGILGPPSASAPTPQPKDQTSPFQQIQDAILASMKSGSSSHTFLRTFRQSVEALTGQPFATTEPSDPDPDLYSDNELSLNIPSVLRRELKIVDGRFGVRLVQNRRNSLSLILHVSLTESKLPRVPPLKIYIPPEYPDESPSVLDLRTEYGSTGFLSSVARTLKSRLLHLPQRFTVLELLNCWEMSVRQVCNPNYKATAATRKQLSTGLAQAFL